MSTRSIIPVFFAVDDNYAPNLHVLVESIIAQSNPNKEYHLNFLVENLSEKNKKSFLDRAKSNIKIFITDMTKQSKENNEAFKARDYYTNTIYFRSYIPEMFPQYDKALYLDADMVVNCDIAELFDMEMYDNYALVANCETSNSFPPFKHYIEYYMGFKHPWYFNSGFMVLNTSLLRKEKFQTKFFDLLHKHKFELIPDQDMLNILFRGRCIFLPQVWNKIPLKVDGITDNNVKIVHYNCVFRPWRYDGIDFAHIKYDKIPFEDIFWKHAKNCPAYQELLDIKKNYSDEDKKGDAEMMNNLVLRAVRLTNLPIEQTFAGLYHTGIIRLLR
ncbi:MAG: glycosyltransferase family 8 protein [Clostridiales bacterium]|jgi:lipopolysaccharide biosynthesis glycosyltransferase|nr:glycosyltransferase family 8 protein [Clostridiales bacterium]